MDKFSLVRSFRHHNSDHGPADHYMLTGYFPTAGFNPILIAEQPAAERRLGHRRKLGPKGSVPPYVVLAEDAPQRRPGVPRGDHAPFVIDADPNAPNFSVPDLVPPPAIAADRLDDRRKLLDERRPLPQERRGEGERARPGGRHVPRQGVRPDDLAGRRRRPSTSTPSPTSCATSTAATRSASRA